MKIPADSLLLALANFAATVIGCVWLRFPAVGLVGVVSALILVPVLLLLTLCFMVRDLRSRTARRQALGAAALSLLPLAFYLLLAFDY